MPAPKQPFPEKTQPWPEGGVSGNPDGSFGQTNEGALIDTPEDTEPDDDADD